MVRFITILVLLTSCSRDFSKLCSELYPCRDSTIYVGISVLDSIPYIEYVRDTIFQNRDSTKFDSNFDLWKIGKLDSTIHIKFLDSVKYIPVIKYKYITRQAENKIVKVRDLAKEKLLERKISNLESKLTKKEKKINFPLWIILFFAIGSLGFKYLKKL